MNTQYDSRTADKFVVRLPDGLRNEVQGAADHLDTSMNTVFVQAVRQYLDNQKRQQLLLDALAKAVTGKEELDAVLLWRGKHTQAIRERDALQQHLTAADERADVLEGLLREASEFEVGENDHEAWQDLLAQISLELTPLAALKLARPRPCPVYLDGCDGSCKP